MMVNCPSCNESIELPRGSASTPPPPASPPPPSPPPSVPLVLAVKQTHSPRHFGQFFASLFQMNLFGLLLVVGFASLAFAEDFKAVNGKEYKDATVSRVEPDGIVLKTKSGITKIYFSELSKDVQERFHYNSARAAQFDAAQQAIATQQDAAKQQEQQQQQQRRADEIKKNIRTVREVEAINQDFLIKRSC